MQPGPFASVAGDLAPGDRAVLDSSWSDFEVEAVCAEARDDIAAPWGRLWREFGERGEMERREVIEDRLRWDPAVPIHGVSLLYELLVVRRRGEVVALRDHTAIVTAACLAGEADVVVHLSHVLVEPAMRGLGLASWLRALPIDAARRCLARARLAAHSPVAASAAVVSPITLVAEMEADDGVTPAVVRRLRSYAKAGFRLLDPSRAPYRQPDFRSAAEIDASGLRSVPLGLVVRRVGREGEPRVRAGEVRDMVAALQAMFAVHVRSDHMEDVRALAAMLPAASETIELMVPGALSLSPGSGEASR